MTNSRLSLALDAAAPLPDAGDILLVRPTAETDPAGLPRERVQVVTGFRPDHDRFLRMGYRTGALPVGDCAAAILILPRARALARALVLKIAAYLPVGAPILIDGQKHDGIDAMFKDIRARTAVTDSITKAHGRAFWFPNPGASAFDDWEDMPAIVAPGFLTRAGVFSADGVDPGSALLAAHLPAVLKGKGADLGAGWGWLAAQVLAHPEVKELHLVEAEAIALDCARENITDPRARFHWADATGFHPESAMDFVVMNPPFHQGRAADPSLGAAFIRAAARMLQPSGHLWLVANRTLPYEETLGQLFGTVTPVALQGGFKVLHATRPLPARKHGL